MTLNAAALAVAANAVEGVITHLQLHNGAPGAGYTGNVVGSRVAATGAVADNNAITKTGVWTGLPASQAVTHISYWSAVTGGVNYGGEDISSGDLSANAAGELTVNVTETGSAS